MQFEYCEIKDYQKLDNPVWFSLTETHNQFALDYTNIKFYHPDFCPFGGFEKNENLSRGIGDYSIMTDNFFVVGEKPELPQGLKVNKELVCLQMIMVNKIYVEPTENITQLTSGHQNLLYQLVNLVQPGYFKEKTALLGNYFGIFKEGQLVAVTGERMKMSDFIEVSAIVTHPDHTGKGYAGQLIAYSVNNIINQNKTPYLHVVGTNFGAVRLYEKLGFHRRRKISFWNITK
ncbi:MAG TPA: GNAT family N-acetyltransferase [Flavitalea sp.]|nr:GNAT family N-acetyltransferase [Flavitalea sp.]